MKYLHLPSRQAVMAMAILSILDFMLPATFALRLSSLLVTAALTLVFAAQNVYPMRKAALAVEYFGRNWLDLIVLALLVIFAAEKIMLGSHILWASPLDSHERAYGFYSTVFLLSIALKTATRRHVVNEFLNSLKLRPPQTMAVSYGIGMLVGSLILTLPQSVVSLGSVNFIDAWFTATSAICVTGLAVNDLGSTYTFFGQFVIVLLMQAGGLGIMFFAAFFAMLTSNRLSLRSQENLRAMMDVDPFAPVASLVKRMFVLSIAIEGVGAVILALSFLGEHSLPKAAWLGVFHSVSGFCNAGLSLFPNGFSPYSGHEIVNLALMSLVILGGLGIPVLDDLYEWGNAALRRKPPPALGYHTKIVLVATVVLLAAGTLFIFALEYGRTLGNLGLHDKILASMFHSTCARTAGFSTIDLSQCRPATAMGLMVLMFTGGAPASTAGGFKVTTVVLLLLALRSALMNRQGILAMGRRIPEDVVYKAMALLAIGTLLFGILLEILLIVQPGEFRSLLFEAVSAFNTVGWSFNLTSKLSGLGKIVIIMTMYIGRIGPLTLAMALAVEARPARFSYPAEKVLIG